MDPVTAALLFGTELLKFLNSQPEAQKQKNWERWDKFWEPILERILKPGQPPTS